MNADLVGPASVQLQAEAGPVNALVLNPVFGDGPLSIRRNHPGDLAPPPGNRLIDNSMVIREPPTDHRCVFLEHLVLLDLLADHTRRHVVLGDQEQAAGEPVQTGNQVGPQILAPLLLQITLDPV